MNININFHVYVGSKWSRWFNKSAKEKVKPLGKTPFIESARAEIKKASSTCSHSTTDNRLTAINAFSLFLKDRAEEGLSLEEMTTDHIKAFERWSLDKGQKLNYVRCNLRNLRALINRINNGRGKALFEGIRTSNAQTDKRAVDEGVIKRLEDKPFHLNVRKALARDIFLFCFYAMGIPLVDAAFLKKSQLKDGYIIYYRQKTHRQVKIKVVPKLEQVIARLTPPKSPYLLPILTSENQEDAKHQYQRFLQRYNRTLAGLSKDIRQDCRLTSYTPRHSWASIAFKKGININVISQALGHANTRTTQTYIRDLTGDQLNEANMTVIQSISVC